MYQRDPCKAAKEWLPPWLLYCTHLTRALEVCEPELPPWPMMSGTKKDSSTCFDIRASKSGHSSRRRWGSAVAATVCSWMRKRSRGYRRRYVCRAVAWSAILKQLTTQHAQHAARTLHYRRREHQPNGEEAQPAASLPCQVGNVILPAHERSAFCMLNPMQGRNSASERA